MESIQSIPVNEVPQKLATNQVTEIQLKDGTVLKLAGNSNRNSQEKYILRHPGKDSTYVQKPLVTTGTEQSRAVLTMGVKSKHHVNNFKDANMGAFGQYYKTEYNDVCTHLLKAKGKLKQRKNYVLYVSKNCTEENNITRKNRRRPDPQKKPKTKIQNNIPQYQPGPGEKIVSTGYIECDDVPVFAPKIRLRNEQNKGDLCPDCQNEVLVNQYEQNLEPVAAEYMAEGEGEEDLNQEKLTTTVQVLVPEN